MTPARSERRVERAFPAEPLPVPRRRRQERGIIRRLPILVALVLLGNAIVGESGLVASFRAQSLSAELLDQIDTLSSANDSLRKAAERLRKDPAVIEAIAREELGLIQPGEILIVISDQMTTEHLPPRARVSRNPRPR